MQANEAGTIASTKRAGLTDTVAALTAGEVSSLELVEQALEDIAATQPTLNAFRIVCTESAIAEALEADRRLASGERAPLLGVPVAIKDDVDLAGRPTAFGCAGEFPAKSEDSEVVRRLRVAGAVIVGKTNAPEVGLYPFTEGCAFGSTRNPWSLDHTPGGSSGGSAAAVAAGIVPGAVGSDGAGSVRIPAAWCGLVGLKPQRGRISTWPDTGAFNGLSCIGPLTRTVADCALMLDVMSGPHPGERHIPPLPAEPFTLAAKREPGRLRIALSMRAPFSGAPVRLDPEIAKATKRMAGVLAELGHEVIEANPSYGPKGLLGLTLVARGQAGVWRWTSNVPDRSLLDRRTRESAIVGGVLARSVLPFARGLEPWLARRVGSIFERVDVVLSPTSASLPLRVGRTSRLSSWATDQVVAGSCPYAWAWNVLGWPGMSVPSGVSNDGLPVGIPNRIRQGDRSQQARYVIVIPHPAALEIRELEYASARLVQELRKRHLIARELLLHLASASSTPVHPASLSYRRQPPRVESARRPAALAAASAHAPGWPATRTDLRGWAMLPPSGNDWHSTCLTCAFLRSGSLVADIDAMAIGRPVRVTRAGVNAEQRYQRGLRSWRRQTRPLLAVVCGPFILAGFVVLLLDKQLVPWTAGLVCGAAVAMWVMFRETPPRYVEQWHDGAEGERKTEAALMPLEQAGWTVVHDVKQRYGNYDHIAVGPSGVYLLETKNPQGSMEIRAGVPRQTRRHDPEANTPVSSITKQALGAAASLKEEIERRTGHCSVGVCSGRLLVGVSPAARGRGQVRVPPRLTPGGLACPTTRTAGSSSTRRDRHSRSAYG